MRSVLVLIRNSSIYDMNNATNKKNVVVEFNIIRAFMGVCIFLYHAYYNMDCRYGRIVDPVISQCSFFMTMFFMLSGYVLYHSNVDSDYSDKISRNEFYKKRIMRLYPFYFLVWIIFYIYDWPYSTVKQDIVTFPLQLLLLQNTSHYDYLMNSGTWFFSCMMICYLLFPLLKSLVKEIQLKGVIFSIIISVWVISTFPLLSYLYATESYQNSFGRIFEFLLGILIARLVSLRSSNKDESWISKKLGVFGLIQKITSLILIWKLNTTVDLIQRNQEFFKIVASLLGGCILYCLALNSSKWVRLFSSNPVISFLSSISFEFWIATFFTTEIYKKILRVYLESNPFWHNFITILINLLIALLLKRISVIVTPKLYKYSLLKMFCVVAGVFIALFVTKAIIPYPFN